MADATASAVRRFSVESGGGSGPSSPKSTDRSTSSAAARNMAAAPAVRSASPSGRGLVVGRSFA